MCTFTPTLEERGERRAKAKSKERQLGWFSQRLSSRKCGANACEMLTLDSRECGGIESIGPLEKIDKANGSSKSYTPWGRV
mmetsp:Transcript_26814/g.48622  ORF Transcript_26814/g.48622 Transcript_26814/m.48622 type:complete len:81 (+) Transcript_26814:385-627(+)